MRISYLSPSYKRAKGAITQETFPFVKYVVAEFEAEEYAREGHDCWVVPDHAQGSVAKIRNYILDNALTEKIVMLDDDMTGIARWENQKAIRLTPNGVQEFCEMGFQMAEDLDIKYWGMNMLSDKGAYREYTPLAFKSCILGPFQAFNDLELRYDEKLPLKEDYDLSLQVLNKYRKTLRFNAYHYLVKQHTNTGGCADYRTVQYEKDQMQALVRKWGSKIVKEDKSSKGYDINPIIKVPIGGV
ncbi:MAG: hypothetical protein ACPGXY_01600 [Alphaproteobacteria bacterium]